MPLDPTSTPRGTPRHVDLLVVGALTVDHFADGSSAAGGSALHATRAASAAGYATAVVTIAGDEPEAMSGLTELVRLARLHVLRADRSVDFVHRDTPAGRELVLGRQPPMLPSIATELDPRSVLYAPVAAEFGADLAGLRFAAATRGAILQGWLRSLEPGRTVLPLSLTALHDDLVTILADFDALFASTEDLRAVAATPATQLDALRDRFGARPLLVVTDGTAGAWLDEPGARRLVAPPTVVDDVSTVGAGDAFAAVMLVELGRGRGAADAARQATDAVGRLLADRVT